MARWLIPSAVSLTLINPTEPLSKTRLWLTTVAQSAAHKPGRFTADFPRASLTRNGWQSLMQEDRKYAQFKTTASKHGGKLLLTTLAHSNAN